MRDTIWFACVLSISWVQSQYWHWLFNLVLCMWMCSVWQVYLAKTVSIPSPSTLDSWLGCVAQQQMHATSLGVGLARSFNESDI